MLKCLLRKAGTQIIVRLLRLNLLTWHVADDHTDDQPGIYVFWHKHYLPVAKRFAHQPGRYKQRIALCSPSHDGTANAALLKSLGYQILWGSSHKQGAQALEHMLNTLRSSPSASVFLACDGSRGPAQQMKLGALYLAQKTGLPIFLVSAKINRFIKLNTWDQTLIPLPFAYIKIQISAPEFVSANHNKQQLSQLAKDYSSMLSL